MSFCDEIRAACARIARDAEAVRIDLGALERFAAAEEVAEPTLDPERHHLDGPPEEIARYLLTLDAINFGSGWFPTLAKRTDATGRPVSGYFTVAWNLADHHRAHGAWTNAQLRAMRTDELAAILGQRADHELLSLYAQALRELGRFLGDRDVLAVVADARGSAERLARTLATGMTLFADPGFAKRAQIVPNDLALAGVAGFADLDRLTIFADNLVPHVLRRDGVLVYAPGLAEWIDAGRLLPSGRWEREIRACALHACVLLSRRTGVPERTLDTWLWQRGQAPEYKAHPRHRCRSVYY
ncbi:hypothetical protein GKE82_03495 [Conexibacter sp. W3-3-2]|uniref:queuosine salvage family protein n=1 Tax=Conexibacter sp. W3-3-2 TaxID=2675227 RepID=UPI00132844F0|nr:queuosine salvage family protein [Conexibacter sp. W3-3-2]MTD43390.1 hypothetical protein [Conexibacter sp. W3-3-2]